MLTKLRSRIDAYKRRRATEKLLRANGGTAVYCTCRNELISSDSFVSDEEIVTYQCTVCGEVSRWDFDCIVPIRLESGWIHKTTGYVVP